MADRPEQLPEWATEDQTDDVSGQQNVVEPPSERKESGWDRREIPPRQWQNWLARLYYRWIEWARDKIDSLDSRVTTNEDDISSNNNDISSLDSRVTTNEGDIDNVEAELDAATNEETPDTLAKRDADGRMRAKDPEAAQDVATKKWTEDQFDPSELGQSLTENGYSTFPGGLILQWGGVQLSGDGTLEEDVSFPITFPNEVFNVTIGFLSTTGDTADSCYARDESTSGFTAGATTNTPDQELSWIAVGY